MTARPYRVLWAPFPGMQTLAVNAAEDEVLFGGAKGPGKSDCGIAIVARQTDKERYTGYVIRETGPQLDELKVRMHRLYPKMATKPAWNGDGHGRWTWPSGARVILESIATPEDVEKIQGKEPSVIFHDEVGNVADERVIDLEQAELRSPDPTIKRMWRGSANPGKAGHAWIKRRFITPCGVDGRKVLVRRVRLPDGSITEKTRRFIPGTVLDNPIYANDPQYMATLATLPEVLRRQLLYGDWNAGVGAALDELDESVHIVPRFDVPSWFTMFGGFDYGYAHNWVWLYLCVSEDGRMWVVDTVRGRRHQLHTIAERVKSRVPLYDPRYLYTDTDTYPFQRRKERDENSKTYAELFQEDHDILVRQGNTDRKRGLLNLRHALAWRGLGPDGSDGDPILRFMDTPGNRWLFEQLQAMVVDEADMEDVLKVNSHPETGEGGDDGYDALRVAVVSRPIAGEGRWRDQTVTAFSKQTLAHMVETLYRDRPGIEPRGVQGNDMGTYLGGY